MKYCLLFFLLVGGATGLSAQATDSLDAKIERLLKLSGAEAQFATIMDQMIGMQRQNPAFANALGEQFWDEFSAEIRADGFAKLLPMISRVYRDNYTEAEIDHQLAYLAHPLSRVIVAKQPALMRQSMTVGAEWGQALGQRIAERLRQEIKDKN